MDDATAPKARPLLMSPRSGTGKELCDLLRERLGIPCGVRWFEVRFASDEPVSVRLDYLPQEPRDAS